VLIDDNRLHAIFGGGRGRKMGGKGERRPRLTRREEGEGRRGEGKGRELREGTLSLKHTVTILP